MKTITRRPSTSLSRAILAAFLISLPGSREAFAQVTGRVGAAGMGSGVSAQAGAALGGLTSAPGLSVPLSPMNLSLSAPSVGAPAPVPAPAALTPAALRPAALAAAIKSAPVANEPRADVHAVPPFKAPRALVALVPGAQESAAAIDSLIETAGESKDDGHGPSSGQRFDGNRRRASGADDGDGKGGDWNRGALVPGALPAEAPVLALNKIFFPA